MQKTIICFGEKIFRILFFFCCANRALFWKLNIMTPRHKTIVYDIDNLLHSPKTKVPDMEAVFGWRIKTIPGWGAIRKWPLIRSSPTHTVCYQTKITGSVIWFQRTIVWSEVTSVWGWYDQRSLRSEDGMIRGQFGLGMVWSEFTLVCGWYDQKSLQDRNGLIRGGFKRTLVWSETISIGIFFWFFVFYREMSALSRGNKKQHSDHRQI